MELSAKVLDALNKQLNAELYSSYMYLSMAAYFDSTNLGGLAHWMKVQAQEELLHAMRFYEYVNDRGGIISLPAVDKPPATWKAPLSAFEAAYAHEQKVTGLIHALVDLSAAESDHATVNFLQWFIAEQVEEESTASDIVEKMRMIGDNPGLMIMLDRGLGKRKPKLVEAAGE